MVSMKPHDVYRNASFEDKHGKRVYQDSWMLGLKEVHSCELDTIAEWAEAKLGGVEHENRNFVAYCKKDGTFYTVMNKEIDSQEYSKSKHNIMKVVKTKGLDTDYLAAQITFFFGGTKYAELR
jgi:hypothetical protein